MFNLKVLFAISMLFKLLYLSCTTYKYKTLYSLDAPCGDMTWMSQFLKGRKDVDYTGNRSILL
jgi:hypothetical protein